MNHFIRQNCRVVWREGVKERDDNDDECTRKCYSQLLMRNLRKILYYSGGKKKIYVELKLNFRITGYYLNVLARVFFHSSFLRAKTKEEKKKEKFIRSSWL